jgi:hypothetical protein
MAEDLSIRIKKNDHVSDGDLQAHTDKLPQRNPLHCREPVAPLLNRRIAVSAKQIINTFNHLPYSFILKHLS